MIYFIRDTLTKHVKIGFSETPWNRLTYLQIGSPSQMEMLGVIEGSREDEARLHVELAAHRVRGEWFRWSAPVEAAVGALSPCPVRLPHDPERQRKKQILRAIEAQGFSGPYASQLTSGARPWPLDIAIGVWRLCAIQVGPLAEATGAELAVLEKYAPHFRPSRPVNAKPAERAA